MKFFKNFNLFLAIALIAGTFTACVDLEFDEPDLGSLTEITANTTIAELNALHTIGEDAKLIEDDLIIRGVVIADDLSGNFFKNLTIQDETGGIQVRLNLVGLSDFYPQGSEVFVQCKGLYVGDFAELPQLSGTIDGDAIEEVLVGDFVIPGKTGQDVTPEVVILDQLADPTFLSARLNTLIQIENVEFAPFALGSSYAVSSFPGGVNLDIQDCNENTIILRSSTFADFAAEEVPSGNGSLTAVLGRFRDDIQLIIRDTDDVAFDGPRCDGSTGGGGDLEQIDIIELRELFATGGTMAPADRMIKGVIISDDNAQNLVGQNLFIQDATGGIVVRFTDFHNLPLGTEIEVNVSGQELSEFNGLLQVNNVPLFNVTDLGTGSLPTPREATISEILANADAWESTLVKVVDATITGSNTFAGSTTVSDASGSIPMFTRNDASFSGNAIPSGMVELTAIVGEFNSPQLYMRNGDDVTGGGSTGGDPVLADIMTLRTAFEGGSMAAPTLTKIRGVVISDIDNGNLTGRNLVVQDGSGGIVVRFEDEHSFALGEEIEVNVSGEELSEFNGLLQVNNVPNNSAVSFGNGTMPTPRDATVQEIIDNAEEWESTLVRISDVTISGSADGTYNATANVTDASATIVMFTRGDASFSGTTLPAGTVTMTAIVTSFNAPQVAIRNLNDIQ